MRVPADKGQRKYMSTAPKQQHDEQAKSPMPKQHQPKPGIEATMNPRPEFLAPHYKGAGKLTDKIAIITGGDSGIGRAVAVLYAREGADVALVFTPGEMIDAEETAEHVRHEGRACLLIPGDVKDSKFCAEAIQKTVDEFGMLDILV